MHLYIDTTDFNSVAFTVLGAKKIGGVFKLDSRESHKLLETLEKFLKRSKTPVTKIEKITVCSGPGSYTGVRVGMAQTLALGLGWNVPVSFLKKPQFDKTLQVIAKKS